MKSAGPGDRHRGTVGKEQICRVLDAMRGVRVCSVAVRERDLSKIVGWGGSAGGTGVL